jgi:glycine/D-amino acid oxidase-like deaminating enzyme
VETEDSDVAIVGAGVVGCDSALALARRAVATALLECEPIPGLAASRSNLEILHSGFDAFRESWRRS